MASGNIDDIYRQNNMVFFIIILKRTKVNFVVNDKNLVRKKTTLLHWHITIKPIYVRDIDTLYYTKRKFQVDIFAIDIKLLLFKMFHNTDYQMTILI